MYRYFRTRHKKKKRGGHSSEEDRQKLLLKPVNDTNFLAKILLADCDWAGTPVYWREMVIFSGKLKDRFHYPNE